MLQFFFLYLRLFFFFFNDTATTEIYTLSLHDALPISQRYPEDFDGINVGGSANFAQIHNRVQYVWNGQVDRKSTRLNSSHGYISYAVFCLKKKKKRHNSNELDVLTGYEHIP